MRAHPLPRSFKIIFGLTFVALLLTAFLSPTSGVKADELNFAHSTSQYEAVNYRSRLIKRKSTEARSVADWIRIAIVSLEENPHRSRRAYEAALGIQPDKATLWLSLSKTIRTLSMDNNMRGVRHGLYRDGSGAAFNAYRYASGEEAQAEALAVLAYFLRGRSYWRPALDAYKASLDLVANDEIQEVYEQLRAEKGFRITNYSINSDLKQPQLCIQFSEQLFARGTDYATFFKINEQDPAGVRVERRQICLDGFAHGETYKVAVRQGLPSVVGEQLLKSSNLDVYVRDRSPSVRFASKAYVLPKFGQQGLPLMSVNTEKAGLALYRVGDRNLVSAVLDGQFQSSLNNYQAGELKDKFGAEVWRGELDIKSQLNEDIKTAVPVQKALTEMKPGLYVIRAWPIGGKYGERRGSSQWFIISDIGLSTLKADNGLYGFVRSISDASPLQGVKMRLIAHNNEVLGEALSDDKGMVKFEGGLLRGKGGNRPALLVADRNAEGDYGFVDLTKAAFDLTDRGVGGRAAPGPMDAYLYAERGVYRPGEEVHLTALLRNQLGAAVADLPLSLIITRPDGKEHRRVSLPDQGAGGRSYSMELINSAMTGTWRVEAFSDVKGQPIGSTSFLVEDYVPERMELTLKSDEEVWSQENKAELKISGTYLYGAAAAKHELRGDYTISLSKDGLKGFKDFNFGLADEKFLNVHNKLTQLGLLNEKGKTTAELELPDFERPSKPLEARVNIRLLEPGGRQVVRAVKFPVANEKPMIGIRKVSTADEMKTGGKGVFEIVSLDSKAKQTAQNLKWELVEITKDYQWYSQDGRWRYESVVYTNRVAEGAVETSEDGPVKIDMPVKRGQYRLEVVSETYNQLAASVEFSVDWYAARDADTPDVLEIAADKPSYAVGDKMVLTVKPKAAGKTLIALMNETVLDIKEVELGPEGGDVSFDVTEPWGIGTYVIAMHYHRLDESNAQMPGRAIGVKWLKTEEKPRQLSIAMDLPEKHGANQELSLPVTLTGVKPGEKTYVAITAVDEGILSLTHYESPRPDKYFYGQRRLASEIRDVYGHLIDGMNGAVGEIRTGGDAGGLDMQGAPNSIKPVALFSGVVAVDEDGKAVIKFNLPQFNGSLRFMAVAWSATKLGANERTLIVRDPVVMLSSMPLFLTKGDQSRLFLSIDNVDGVEGPYKLEVTSSEGLGFDKQEMAEPVDLEKGKRVNLALTMKALKMGAAEFKVSLTHESGFSISQSEDIYIKPPQPDASWRTVKRMAPEGGKLTFTRDVFADIIPESASASLTVGNLAGLDVAGLFEALNRYPYGCAEQTTSRALPLLYVSRIAPFYGESIEKDIPERIKKAVAHLASLQNSAGGFGLWSPHRVDMWLTAYVTDFLTRAREQKFDVPDEMISTALARLKNSVNFAPDFSSGGEDIAYALYVLARNGEANIGDLRYYADTKIKTFSTPLAKAQVAAALAMYGDVIRSKAAFKVAYTSILDAEIKAEAMVGTSYYRRDYGTQLRDRAALLALSAEAKQAGLPKAEMISAVVDARAKVTYTSTQENAWLLLAANALEEADRAILLSVNGEDRAGLYQKTFKPDDLAEGSIEVINKSAEEVSAVLTVHGSSENPLPAFEQEIGIKRQFYTLDGKEISLLNAKQNDRVVVVVTIVDKAHKGGRLLLADHLPAGFMIENPNLVTGSDLKNFSWLKRTIRPVHQSFRDDKFVAAFNLRSVLRKSDDRILRVAYIMRAAHEGRYIHPAAHVEDMYRPNRFARTGAQNVIIDRR